LLVWENASIGEFMTADRWDALQARLEALSDPELRALLLYFVRSGVIPLSEIEMGLIAGSMSNRGG
jgi:hypothetical protein